MTFMDDVSADVDACFLTDFVPNGGITQYPGGSTVVPVIISGVFEFKSRELDRQRGKGWECKGSLLVDTNATLTNQDAWLIDGIRWDTETIDDPVAGLIEIHLVRYESEYEGMASQNR